MTPTNRKMRRARDVSTSGDQDETTSGFDLYNIQGDTRGALGSFLSAMKEDGFKSTHANDYNLILLRHLESQGETSRNRNNFLQDIDKVEAKSKSSENQLSDRLRKRNNTIMAHNRALMFLATGETGKAVAICRELLKPFVTSKKKPSDEVEPVLCRVAFLLLECLLTVAVGRNSGFGDKDFDCPSPVETVEWLDTLDIEQDPQLKFLLALYKGRVDLAHLDEAGKNIDSKVRSARKELKTAMEIFQHKLRASLGGDSGSVVSSANSEEVVTSNYTGVTPVAHEYQQQQPPSSTVLQKYNQSALSLKANLEQLKGNTKKSLILCTEAEVSAKDDGTYNAIHSNNHAVVYETNGRRHLALHALSKALRAGSNTPSKSRFHKDGTARPDFTMEILHNSAICALQARHYVAAYECMATCVSKSEVFYQRPRCWLRLAEACIGHFSEISQNQPSKASATTVVLNSEPHGVVMHSSCLRDDIGIEMEPLAPFLGSAEDIEQLKRHPLLRARFALKHVINAANPSEELDVLTSARLCLAYVSLSFKEYSQALNLSREVLELECETGVKSRASLRTRRQFATARMYAAESLINLGEKVDAMKYLVGDGKDDAFDRLASDIAGVTLETAAVNEKGKRRLAKAQAMVRSSACAVSAAMGNVQAAKQLANSANAMEDAYASNRERSCARRALVYALLKDGHQAPALNMLMSLR